MGDKRSRLNKAVEYGRNPEKVLFPGLDRLLPLVGNNVVADIFNQHIHNVLHIAYNRDFGLNVFADFSRVDVDMNHKRVFAHLVRRGNRSVAEPCAANDNQIRVVKRAVCDGRAVGTEHTEVKLVLAGHNADSHHR